MTAYYNEIDPFAAQWLRELIKAGHIAPGDVDERSIEDVTPDDLRPYTQCHFFAGIGVWSRALRQAGWLDDRPVWTGSCPCQPFSAAGKGGGFDDERHLWPSWDWLIDFREPPVIFGEQVASKDAEPWLDLVQADLEDLGYAFGAVAFPSASVGAPHIRDRTYWVADAARGGRGEERQNAGGLAARSAAQRLSAGLGAGGGAGGLANALGERGRSGQPRSADATYARLASEASGLADAAHGTRHGGEPRPAIGQFPQGAGAVQTGPAAAGPVNGLWRDADWLLCRDGKWRPVEPGTFPLAHGAPARVGRLRGFGNAINAQQAQIFVEAYLESGVA